MGDQTARSKSSSLVSADTPKQQNVRASERSGCFNLPHPAPYSLIRKQRMNRRAIEFGPSIEERQLDHESGSDDGGAAFAHQRYGAGGSSAGGEHVVDDQNAVVGGECIVMDLQDAAAVFERVFAAARFCGELAPPADRAEA